MLVSPFIDAALAGVFGLLVGSFLNVLIYRLPIMMYRDWLTESIDNLRPVEGLPSLWSLVFGAGAGTPGDLQTAAIAASAQVESLQPISLARPRSRCPHCGAEIRWYQNVPVLSWLALRGKCASCAARISVRYPLVEIVTAAFFSFCTWRFGASLQAAFWMAFCAILICQFLIDLDTQLLPDTLTYPLLWLGLIAAALKVTTVPLSSAVWGAVWGYMSLWLVFQAYKLVTKREGMGHGDFKLLAALGAWLGAPLLLPVILLSSVVGAVLGVIFIIAGRIANRHVPISFGPFLAAAGLVVLVVGPAGLHEHLPFLFAFERI